jgi:histidinol-phosphate aminotransferase
LAAIAACCDAGPVAEAAADTRRLAALRAEMADGLRSTGVDVVDGPAPFVLFRTPGAEALRTHLLARKIAVRRCDTFVGLDGSYLRAAVRPEWPLLAEAIAAAAVNGAAR